MEDEAEVGLHHIALVVRDLDASVAFYARFAGMEVVHRRHEGSRPVVWLSDLSRPFAIVLVEADAVDTRLDGVAHLGVGCASRLEVDRRCELARSHDCLELAPRDAGPPVGYFALLCDPDGHQLELSYGQRVAGAVERGRGQPSPRSAVPSPLTT